MPVRTDLCDLPAQKPSLTDEPSGRLVARLTRFLAAGSSAAVFAGTSTRGEAVAVKVLLPKARRLRATFEAAGVGPGNRIDDRAEHCGDHDRNDAECARPIWSVR